jgi:pyruvate,water dikinase
MKWLDEIHDRDLPEVGRKALVLAELKRAGLPVPDGFVVTHSTCRAIFMGNAACGDPKGAARSILEREFPRAPGDQIACCARRLGFPVAVRSSAVREDLTGASFAGLYETVLNVGDEREVLQALRSCWASLFSNRLRRYIDRQGISPDELGLAVLVQKQIPAEVSGVLFTVNPVTGDDREMMVEAVSGLGESLVSGRVEPDRYLVDAFAEQVIARKRASLEARSGTSPGLAGRSRVSLLLDDERLLDLTRLALQIQVACGAPQDIEWALADGRLHILQARHITRITYQGIDGEWTTADFRDGGVAAEVAAPFLWSLYEHVWEWAMPCHLARLGLAPARRKTRWSRVCFGRPYWNLGAVKEALARLPGYRERNLDQDVGIQITYEGDGHVNPFRWRDLPRALRVLLGLEHTYVAQKRRARRALARFERLERAIFARDFAALGDDELNRLFTDLLRRHHLDLEGAYFQTVFTTANARLDFKAVLDNANQEGAGLDCLSLIADLKPLASLRPLYALWGMSRTVRLDSEAKEVLERGEPGKIQAHPTLGVALRLFLATYGHHSTRELDLMVPRWDEDPSQVIETLRRYVGLDDNSDPSLQDMGKRQGAEGERDRLHRFLAGRTRIRRWLFLQRLERVRFYTWYREEVRDRSTRMYRLIRKVSLEVGRRLVERGVLDEVEDLFYLPYEEAIALFRGEYSDRAEVRRRIAVNRSYLRSFRNFKNPNEVGARWQYRHDHSRLERSGSVYCGIPCAPGRVSGRARIVRHMGESERLARGEILVTRFTDPGWTPLFPMISGVITETGGVLSHAAVIAREYGVPAVLAVPEATTIIPDGQMVVLDGNRGEVRILC